MAEVWPGTVVEESNLQVQISALRKVLGEDPQGPRYLVTVPSRGYRFVAPIEHDGAANSPASSVQQPPPSPAPLALPDKPSIAVLPFANMSADPEHDYFADGMAEEILTALARSTGLFVIARNSSFVYKDRAVDIRQVGRELWRVRYVLEGSVRPRPPSPALHQPAHRCDIGSPYLGRPVRWRARRRFRSAGSHHGNRGWLYRAEHAARGNRASQAHDAGGPQRLRSPAARPAARVRIHRSKSRLGSAASATRHGYRPYLRAGDGIRRLLLWLATSAGLGQGRCGGNHGRPSPDFARP